MPPGPRRKPAIDAAMLAMNECEAFEEARRRWGKDAHVRYRQGRLPQREKPCAVGKWVRTHFEMLGQGGTWEEAFEQAETTGQSSPYTR